MDKEFTTITESIRSQNMKQILKDYFVTKGQRINHDMRKIDPEWTVLKARVQKMIDLELNEQMVIEAQRLNFQYGEKDTKLLVENFREIGKSWKTDGSIGNAKKINQVTYGVFDSKQNRGYKSYFERTIMKELQLEYITAMIARRKADLVNNIM